MKLWTVIAKTKLSVGCKVYHPMSLKVLLCVILVSAVEFTKVILLVSEMKQFLDKIWTADYFCFSTSFNKFVYVFNLNLVGMSSIKMGWPKIHWRIVTWFDWLSSNVTMTVSVANWNSETSWLPLPEFFVLFHFISIFSLSKINIWWGSIQCGKCRFLST